MAREPYGDRRQELVLVGDATSLPAITEGLESCLLTDEEYGAAAARMAFDWLDPFPAWDIRIDR